MANFLKRTHPNTLSKLSFAYMNRSLSTKAAVKEKEDITTSSKEAEEALRTSEKISNLQKRKYIKKPQKPPFVKSLFGGKFDTDILTYPEVLDNERKERLDSIANTIQTYFDNNPDGEFNHKEFRQIGSQLKLFGLEIDQYSGGREYNVTESCRIMEMFAQKTSEMGIFNSEQLGVQVLLKCGSKELIDKYLGDILSGKVQFAFCLAEEDGFDMDKVKTSAEFNANTRKWVLNGQKHLVINGGSADLLIVLAKSKRFDKVAMMEDVITAFLVEKEFGGVSAKQMNTAGLKKTDVSIVSFENTHIPEGNVIGNANQAHKVLGKLLPQYRLMCGIACSEINRKLSNNLVRYCIDTHTGTNRLLENELVQRKLCEIAMNTYALESMNFLTAGLLDQYENQDCEVEAMISKAFGAESCQENITNAMQLLGMNTYLEDHWCNVLLQDSRSYAVLPESTDALKILIALQGLQHAGFVFQEDVRKTRNPLYFPTHIFKNMWTFRWDKLDNPVLKDDLFHYLHPTAVHAAKALEYSVSRLRYATQMTFAHHGSEVINQYCSLKTLGECAIDIYAMTASIGRASRSYCIGLRNCDNELRMAMVFCKLASQRVQQRALILERGPLGNQFDLQNKIGIKLTEVGKYFAEHPLTKNY